MRRAADIVSLLLEDAGDKGMVAFGPGYPPEGFYFEDTAQWRQRLGAQGIVPGQKEPSFEQVLDAMIGRGYSFVYAGSSSVRVLSHGPISTTDAGLDNLLTRFGLEPDSTVIHQQHSTGSKKPEVLGSLIKGYDFSDFMSRKDAELRAAKEAEKTKAEKEAVQQSLRAKNQAWQDARAKEEAKRRAVHQVVGYNAPDPNVIQPYPIDVKLGIAARDTPTGIGVLVTDVEEGSPAATAGLEKNDIIFAIGEYFAKGDRYSQEDRIFGPHRIDNLKEWEAVAGQFVDGDTYELRVLRGDGETAIALIPERISTGTSGPSMQVKGTEMGGRS